jgi:hypothetical protein
MAAKNNAYAPAPNDPTGLGQNSAAASKQIEQSAAPVQLTDQQRQQIRSYFAGNGGQQAVRLASAGFSLSIGAAVPQQVTLQKLPDQVVSALQGFQGDQYVLVGNQLVVVEPIARRVVAIVPDAG